MWLVTVMALLGIDVALGGTGAACPSGLDSHSSTACKADLDDEHTGSESRKMLRGLARDVHDFTLIVDSLEHDLNAWCCAVFEVPLTHVRGDRDSLWFVYDTLGDSFHTIGEEHGSRVVRAYVEGRSESVFRCDHLDDDRLSKASVGAAILRFKQQLVTWLEGHSVNTKQLVESYIPTARLMLGRWALARLGWLRTHHADVFASNGHSAISALLPILRGIDDPEGRCEIAAALHGVVAPDGPTNSLLPEASKLLDECFEGAKLSTNPTEQGAALLTSGREDQAREIFELAVERGALCHPHQLPPGLHVKTLRASAVWPHSTYPGLQSAISSAIDGVADAVSSLAFETDGSLDEISGSWRRAVLFARGEWNVSACTTVSSLCAAISDALHRELLSNDGYKFACGSAALVEIWALGDGTHGEHLLGFTNVVLQYIWVIRGGSLLMRVGEDEAFVAASSHAERRSLIFDDSFDHDLRVLGSDGGEAFILHVQLCHPQMHEEAMSAGGRCP